MKRFITTLGMPKTEWLRYRKMGITGTDAGAITGLNPYKSAFEVYQDKISDDCEDTDNESMRQGRDLEEYVAKRFAEQTGLKVRHANAIFQNENHPIMLADFDRIIIGMGDGKKAGLECKTVSPYSADKWKDGAIPVHYQMQVQHYLAVSGFDYWYIAALILGKEFLIRKIQRDEELIQYLITIEEKFWNENVLQNIMPDPDGTKACTEAITKLYFNSKADKTIDLESYNSLLDRRSEIEELIQKMETEKNVIDQKIKMEMRDATIGITPKYKVSWYSYESNRLDARKLKEEQPDIYKEYCRINSTRRFTVSHAA